MPILARPWLQQAPPRPLLSLVLRGPGGSGEGLTGPDGPATNSVTLRAAPGVTSFRGGNCCGRTAAGRTALHGVASEQKDESRYLTR